MQMDKNKLNFIEICGVCVFFRAIRKRGYLTLLKILIVVNLLICFNMEIYRGIILFWITVSSPIAAYIAFLYILSRFTFYLASCKFKDGENDA